jgi:phage replication-related protein YjqB (UPF0714/DUF867 family)
MATEYAAQVLKLRLPEQNDLRNSQERCSADPVMLRSIGRALGQQVRISRRDAPEFVTVYTAKVPNPVVDLSDPGRRNAVRTGLTGRERLGTDDVFEATVQARVLDDPPGPDDAPAARFYEVAKDPGQQDQLVVIAPHGGEIEIHTDDQAAEAFGAARALDMPASLWLCKGYGDSAKGAFDRWHITSIDLQPACFPLLQALMSRRFCYGVAFHGFERQEDQADVYIGGAALPSLKLAVEGALNRLALPVTVKISTEYDDPKFQGFSPENIINRLATGGIHLEQSIQARRRFHLQIARAIAKVFASRPQHESIGLPA